MGCSKDSGNLLALDNDWWEGITFLDFVREVGRYARVETMMPTESVKKWLMSEEGISYTEFNYQLLQAYDIFYMFKNMGVSVQIGGSDQWENITAGTELIRKILQVPDVDVVRFRKILTYLNLEEIQELEDAMKKSGYVPNLVQKILAEEVTRFVRKEGLVEALKATEALMPGAKKKLDPKTIEEIAKDVPSCSLPYDRVLNSLLVEISVISGFLGSKSAARRLVKQGGL